MGKQESYGVNLWIIVIPTRKEAFMSVLKEFRDFAVKGNVIDLAVGVIIGGAFGKIVDSLVNDIVMPVISTLLGGHIDFTNLFLVLGSIPEGVPRTFDALKKAGVPIFA